MFALTAALATGVITTNASAEGLYFGGFGAFASVNDLEDIGSGFSFSNGYMIGAVIGTELTENLRIEGELSYQTSEGECIGKCVDPDFDLTTLALLGNAWVDFDAGNGVKPYVGGGIGIANVSTDEGFSGEDDTGLAYQLGLGARFGEARQFDIGYRYRSVSIDDPDSDVTSHMLQFRWVGRF